MAHEIFGKRFASLRQPAWHGLGLVLDVPTSATDALNQMGSYEVHTEPVFLKDGTQLEQQAVIRDATADAAAKVLSVMGPEFRPLGPLATCRAFDLAVDKPIETIGSLKDGETLFVTTKLPSVDIRGDEVEMYLVVINPMGGKKAVRVRITPQRIVCQNTLVIGEQLSTEAYAIRHDEKAEANTISWLREAYTKSIGKVEVIKAACEILADVRVNTAATDELLKAIYPDPRKPINSAPDAVMVRRLEHREYVKEWRETARDEVKKLFAGAGMGMGTKAAAGTAWGLYNAVAEYEDNRWAGNPKQGLESAMFGGRADTKSAAFDSIMKFAKDNN